MRYLTVVFLVLFCIQKGASQTFELGGFVGGVNVIGDVGSTTYVNPNTLAFGAGICIPVTFTSPISPRNYRTRS